MKVMVAITLMLAAAALATSTPNGNPERNLNVFAKQDRSEESFKISLLQQNEEEESQTNCFSTHYCKKNPLEGFPDNTEFCCCQTTGTIGGVEISSGSCYASDVCATIGTPLPGFSTATCGSSTLQISAILLALLGTVTAHLSM